MFSSLSTSGFFFGSSTTPAAPTNIVVKNKDVLPKKRKNKKKKKKTGVHQEYDNEDSDEEENDIGNSNAHEDADENDSSVVNTHAGDDPLTAIVDEVVRRARFERDKVEVCVKEMWDRGLKYDDFDSVLEELRNKEDSEPQQENEDDDADADIKLDVAHNASTHSSTENGHKQSESYHTDANYVNDDSKGPGDVTSLSLSQRLELAASHDNFLEALMTLNAWASVAAPCDIGAFYEGHALDILLESIISKSAESIKPEVRDNMIVLFQKISVLPAHNSLASATTIVTSIETLVTQVHSLNAKNVFPSATATSTSSQSNRLQKALAKRLGNSIRKFHTACSGIFGGGSVQVTLANLDAALAETTAALDRHAEECRAEALRQPAQVDLKGTFIHRDITHERLLYELQAAEVLRDASLRPRAQLQVPKLGGSAEDDLLLESQLLAEAGESRQSIEAKKSHTPKGREDRLISDQSSGMARIQAELKVCTESIAKKQAQVVSLRTQIVQLEAEITKEKSRQMELQTNLGSQESVVSHVSTLNSGHSQTLAAIQVDAGVKSLLAKVRDVESCLTNVISSANKPLAPPAEEYPVRVAAVSEALGSYVESESKCISVLARRVKLVDEKVGRLRREIDEYKSLGMQAVGADIESTIEKLTENSEEDLRTLAALKAVLAESVARFASCLTVDLAGVGMVAMPTAALNKAVLCLTDAGVSIPVELLPFVTAPAVSSAASTTAAPPLTPTVVPATNRAQIASIHVAPPPVTPSNSVVDNSVSGGPTAAFTSFSSHQAAKASAPGAVIVSNQSSAKAAVVAPIATLTTAKKTPVPAAPAKASIPPSRPAATTASGKTPPAAVKSVKPVATPASSAVPPVKSSWSGWKIPAVPVTPLDTETTVEATPQMADSEPKAEDEPSNPLANDAEPIGVTEAQEEVTKEEVTKEEVTKEEVTKEEEEDGEVLDRRQRKPRRET